MTARFTVAVFVTFVVALVARPAPAQDTGPGLEAYDDAVRTYVEGGDLAPAIIRLQEFTEKDFKAAVERIIARKDHLFAQAAAMFQLEVGIGVIVLSAEVASDHFDLGEKLLESLRHPGVTEDVRTFGAAWYGVTGSAFLSVNDPPRARRWLQKALELQPQSAPLKTLLGAAEELDAATFNPDVETTSRRKTRARLERNRRLTAAEQAYKDALRIDPGFAPARIRIGRAQYLRGELDLARVALEGGEAAAQDPAHRYLAALFLGALHHQQGNLAGARAAYERALAIVPQSQTATVALGYVELLLGRPDLAQALARSFAASSTDDRYWWAYKTGGLDEATLLSLRKRVRK